MEKMEDLKSASSEPLETSELTRRFDVVRDGSEDGGGSDESEVEVAEEALETLKDEASFEKVELSDVERERDGERARKYLLGEELEAGFNYVDFFQREDAAQFPTMRFDVSS